MQQEHHNQPAPQEDVVAILDAGSQYGKLIDRRVRELNVASVLLPFDTPASQLARYKAIIISGGPESVYSSSAPKFDMKLLTDNKAPILGICYGFQLMNFVFGGRVDPKEAREDGQFSIDLQTDSALFKGLSSSEKVPFCILATFCHRLSNCLRGWGGRCC